MSPPTDDEPLPQAGWTTEAPWCDALHLKPVSFRRLLKKYGVPFVPFGNSVLINTEVFYQHISKFMDHDDEPDDEPDRDDQADEQ